MRWTKAAVAALALAALLGTPPWALVRFVGNPWPAEGIALSAPFTDGAIIGLLAATVWVLWAQLVLCVVVEVAAALTADRIRLQAPLTLGVQQQLARRLVTAIVVATVSTPVAAGGVAAAATDPATDAAAPTQVADPAATQGDERVATDPRRPGPGGGRDRVGAGQASSRSPADGETATVTVMRLDTLMGIAERVLGDEDRWAEIASLNEGRVMNDGVVFRSADYIRAGWELRVPAPSAPETADSRRVVVKVDDTLSQIALDRLGDADRYPEIFRASRRTTQPGGEHLVDPDHIEPGWVLQLPSRPDPLARRQESPGDAAAAPQAPASTPDRPDTRRSATPPTQPPQSEQNAPQAPTTATAPATAGGVSPRSDSSDADASQPPTLDDGEGWPIRTLGGVAALLAAALLALIGLRRARQRRRRQPGQQMPLPEGDSEQVEREIRSVADGIGLEVVDVALRALVAHCLQTGQPRPQLSAARMTADQLEIYLADPARLPDPWVSTEDPTVWTLPADHAPNLAEPATEGAAPYPALVSVGHDAEEGVVLLDLDHLGDLSLTGDPTVEREAVTAIAVELGTAPWSADLTLTVIGSFPELGDVLEPGRIQYVATPDQVPPPAASGGSHVVLATTPLDQGQRRSLRDLGAVVVTPRAASDHDGEWTLELADRDHGALQPLGLAIRPQLVDERTYRGLLEILATSQLDPGEDIPDRPRPERAEHPVPFGHVPSEPEPPPRTPPDAGTTGAPAPATTSEKVTAPVGDYGPTTVLQPVVAAGSVDDGVPPARTAEAGLHPLLRTGHPVICLLGPVVDIVGATTAAPTSQTHRGICTRLAAYLALNPDTSRAALTEAVWGSGQRTKPQTVYSRRSNLRAWLGTDPATGEAYLPERSLRFTETVTTDWHIFIELVGPDPTTASTDALHDALSLVRGRPLEGEESKHYGFAEYDLERIVSTLVDASYELARRQYMDGTWTKAAQTAALGVLLDPGNERLWRLRIHAAHSAGNPHQVTEAVDRMRARISELGFDLEPETTELLHALDRHDAETIAQAREAL